MAGTQLGLVKAGLDPTLAGIASVGIGSISGSLLTGVRLPDGTIARGLAGLSHTLKTTLAPTLAGELAFAGIQHLGESVGLDPRLSQLAGMPLSSAVRATVTPGRTAEGITHAIWEGLKSGATSVGLQMATQSLGIDPLPGAVITRALSGALSGAVSPAHDIFAGIAEAFRHSAGNFSTIPPPPDPEDPRFIQNGVWNRIAYHQAVAQYEAARPVWMSQALAKTNNFSDEIRQFGLGQALENYAASIFHRDSVESIVQSFGTIAEAVRKQLEAGKAKPITLPDGTAATELALTADGKVKVIYRDADGNIILLGVTEGDLERLYQEARADRQTLQAGMLHGTTTRTLPDGSKLTLEVRNGQVTKARLVRGAQRWLFTGNEVGDLQLSRDGTIFTGQLVDESSGLSFVFDRGQLTRAGLSPAITATLSAGQLAAVADILESSSPILFEPTPAMRQQHLQDFNLEVGNLQGLLAAKLGLGKAQALVADFKQSGQRVIQTPEAQAAEQQRLAEQVSSVELSASERRTVAEVVTGWANGLREKGVQMGMNAQEGSLAYWTGFGVYFLGDLTDIGADPLRIGEGFGKAFNEDLPNKRYGAALWHITEDVFRGIQFIPGVALASRAVSGAVKTVQTTGKVAEASGALSRVSTGIMNFVRTWGKRFSVGDDVLEIGSDAKGALKYEYTFAEEHFKGLSHATSTQKLKSLASGIDKDLLRPEHRFGRGFYMAEDADTAIAEVRYHAKLSGGKGPDIVVQYDLNLSNAKVLDLSDPVLRARYGYIPDPNDYSTGRRAAELAKRDGYNVIKYESVRNPGHHNYVVLDNADFDKVLREKLPLQ